ncbi:10519_t:CDS:2, partial [Gigaspora margarita]
MKRSLNSSSTLCKLEEEMNKRHEQENRYCKLISNSQSFTYEEQREHVISEVCFISELSDIDVVDELQATLKAILDDNGISNIIECKEFIGSYKDNILAKLDQVLEHLPFLTTIELSMDSTIQVNLNIQTKTAINITLKTKRKKENNEPKDGIIALQQHLIDQTGNPHVTKIR